MTVSEGLCMRRTLINDRFRRCSGYLPAALSRTYQLSTLFSVPSVPNVLTFNILSLLELLYLSVELRRKRRTPR